MKDAKGHGSDPRGGAAHQQGVNGIIPAALAGLAAEARKAPTFEDFKKDFSLDIKHGTYWHYTDDPNFHIDPAKGPRDMSSMASGQMDAGKLMVTSRLRDWEDYGPGGKTRPYVAEVDMSDVPRTAYRQVNRGMGNEFFVDDPSKARVARVVTPQTAKRIDAQRHAALPQSEKELELFYKRVRGQK